MIILKNIGGLHLADFISTFHILKSNPQYILARLIQLFKAQLINGTHASTNVIAVCVVPNHCSGDHNFSRSIHQVLPEKIEFKF